MIVAFFNTGCHRPSLASHSWEEVSQGLQLQYYYECIFKIIFGALLINGCLHVCTQCIVLLLAIAVQAPQLVQNSLSPTGKTTETNQWSMQFDRQVSCLHVQRVLCALMIKCSLQLECVHFVITTFTILAVVKLLIACAQNSYQLEATKPYYRLILNAQHSIPVMTQLTL